MRRIILPIGLALALSLVIVGTRTLIDRARADLREAFAADRLELVLGAAHQVEARLVDVVQDLDFVAELVASTRRDPALSLALGALVRSVRSYRGAIVLPARGSPTVVDDPWGTESLSTEELELLVRTSSAALAERAPGVRTSPVTGAPGGGWFRVMAVVRELGGEPVAVGLLVDTRPLLMDLRVFVPDQLQPESQLLVLGPHGRPAPATSPRIHAALTGAEPLPVHTGELLARMRRGERGSLILPPDEAAALGFAREPAVAALAPVEVAPGASWSIAVLTSTTVLRAEEASLVEREVLLALAVTLAVGLVGGYVLVSSRRATVLRERLRSASALARLRARAQEVLDHLPTGVVVLADDGTVRSVNQALASRLGSTRAGVPLDALFPAADRAARVRLAALVAEARAAGRVASAIGERLDLFGVEGHFTVHAVPLASHVEDAGLLLVLEDVSAVRSLEAQLLRAEKLATVGVLAAGIAHEIGTPLGVIRGRAEYVLDKLGEHHAQADKVQVIVEQIDRVARTIRELLDFSRVRGGVAGSARLEVVAAAVEELLRYEAQRRELRLDIRVDPRLPPLAADGDQLQQVLVNLTLNAFDASPVGGRVSVEARRDDVPGRVRLEVVDEGCGIAPELVHRVFDPFFTTKRRGEGTGLGLTIVGHIVRSHDADIQLHAAGPGGGTRVTLSWPVHEAPARVEANHA